MKTLLLVEDSEGDALLIQESFAHRKSDTCVIVMPNGDRALEFLNQKILPDLILLDYNLPGMRGIDFLSSVKVSPAWRHIPVIVYSGVFSDHDIRNLYAQHANGCLLKPHSLQAYENLVTTLEDFWFKTIIAFVPACA